METTRRIGEKILAGQRVNREEALLLWQNATDAELSAFATAVKCRFHPSFDASYLIMSIVNYTNVCVAKCDYCSFYRLPHQSGTYLLSYEQIKPRIEQLIEFGGTMVGFNGGFHPKLRIQDYANIFQQVRRDFGDQIEFYGMTVAEFIFAARVSKMDLMSAAECLKAHGVKWVTGGGSEILDDQFRRRHSPGKFRVDEYFQAQKAILDSGLGSTATMVIGFDETAAERFNHLSKLRDFQDEVSHKLTSFLCWTYKPYNNTLGGEEISTREYLRWMAICRIYLDNFVHMRTSVLTKNDEALEALRYGANDFDLPTEDEVTQLAGATISQNFEQILDRARTLGFVPRKRPPFSKN